MAHNNKRKRRSMGTLILCAVVEIMVLLILFVIIGWNKGVGDWFESFGKPVVKELDVSGTNSTAVVLMRAEGGKVIGGENENESIYPASMTKMMTAILAIEKIKNLNEEITLTGGMMAGLGLQDASQAGFQVGETVTAEDLIYGVLLPSGAECCRALACTISGTEAAFVKLMNDKADSLGMKNTHFRDSTGLHDPDHYSTVYDMAVLLKYCLKNKTFRRIIETPYYDAGSTNMHPDGIGFWSTLFRSLNDPSVTGGRILGGKTGYTSDAGYCLASYAEIEGKEYILVTAAAPADGSDETPHIQDAVKIYNRLGAAAQQLKSQ